MRCSECRFEFDETNESQPVCPACGSVPQCRGDDLECSALLEEPSAGMEELDSEQWKDDCLDFDQVVDPIRLPPELQEAADEAEALLEATGFATFLLPEGFRLFRLPTEHVM